MSKYMNEEPMNEKQEWAQSLQEQLLYELEYSEYLYEMEKKNLAQAQAKYNEFLKQLESQRRAKFIGYLREAKKPTFRKKIIKLYKKTNPFKQKVSV